MLAHRLNTSVEDDHQLRVELPDDFPRGPVEVIVLAEPSEPRRIVSLGGVLSSGGPAPDGDPIAEALDELKAEREERLERLIRETADGP